MGVPSKDSALVVYVANFSSVLATTPADYDVTAQQATAFEVLAMAYQNAQNALAAMRETGVVSKPLREQRDAAKDAMMPTLRSLYGMIQKSITITNSQKTQIGVKVPKSGRSRQSRPATQPRAGISKVFDRTVSMTITNPKVGSRGSKPSDATQTLVYYFAGENYTSDPSTWQFAGVCTSRDFQFTVPDSVPAGTRVWVCAAYTNRRGENGPISQPVSIAVQGTGATPQEAELKIAA